MTEDTKKETIERCCRNDQVAQRQFYDFYKRMLLGMCIRYISNRNEAEDIFQEAFIKIFRSLPTLKNYDVVDGWVKRIVINTAIDHYKSNAKHYDLDEVEIADKAIDIDPEIIAHLSTETLLNEIKSLPDGYRAIFNLYVIDGFSHAEIAEMLQISEGTSKSQLSKAKNQLKKQLHKKGISGYETY